ncbi:MAG: hypothetical protein [Caudoviricetes sp.]|nr:MAG: hypothetical protein [Caudoviricetes sp.]
MLLLSHVNQLRKQMKALDESVIIETFARRKGEEIKEGMFIVGKELHGEIPTFGTVIDVGLMTHGLEPGDVVLIPNGRMTNVVDPRIVAGEVVSNPRQLVATHWKNIQVNYGNKNA